MAGHSQEPEFPTSTSEYFQIVAGGVFSAFRGEFSVTLGEKCALNSAYDPSMITPRKPHKGMSRMASAMILATSLGLSTFGTAAAQTDTPADNPTQADSSASSGSLSGSAADGSAEGSIGSLDGTRAASKVMNDPTCHPAPEHPRPVVFLHGTIENIGALVALDKQLKAEGYCTWGETCGKGGGSAQGMVPFLGEVTDINASAEGESEFSQQVLDTTGADQVGAGTPIWRDHPIPRHCLPLTAQLPHRSPARTLWLLFEKHVALIWGLLP